LIDESSGGYGKKCLLDDTVPEYPANVYDCDDAAECCIEDKRGACCEPHDEAAT